jgi:hypothetical protein
MIHIPHSINIKINQANYTLVANTESHLKGFTAVSSVYDSRSLLPWLCTEDGLWTRVWECVESEPQERWECESVTFSVLKRGHG